MKQNTIRILCSIRILADIKELLKLLRYSNGLHVYVKKESLSFEIQTEIQMKYVWKLL